MTTTTPPDARNALAEIVAGLDGVTPGKDRVQGMVRSITQYRNGDPKAIVAGSAAQVLYALTDAHHDVFCLWGFITNRLAPEFRSIATLVSSQDDRIAALEAQVEGMRVALKPFARIADMEEHQPPAASVMVNVSRCRDARAALQSSETTGEK